MNGPAAPDAVSIRPEADADRAAVREVNDAAFGGVTESELVETLRSAAATIVSLVAQVGDRVVGHIMFSPVSVNGRSDLRIMALAPMAVLPAHQRRGIGSRLVRAGLAACGDLDVGAVVVLGHPEYYPRFGFLPASGFGLRCEYDVPDAVFMALELDAGYLGGVTGTIEFHAAFAA